MAATTVPTADEILTALGRDDRFPLGSEAYEEAKPYIVALPEIVGVDGLGLPVTLEGFCHTSAGLIGRMLEMGYGNNLGDFGVVRAALESLVEQLETIDVSATLAQLGQTEQEAMLGEMIGLNDALKARYLAGELTYADVIREQPGIFLPKS